MNVRLLCKQLGLLAMLIGAFMILSLPWAAPAFGQRFGLNDHQAFEYRGFWALVASTVVCFAVGYGLYLVGRKSKGKLYRKEAMAIVGLSWILATVLGALPYLLSQTHRGPSVRVFTQEDAPQVIKNFGFQFNSVWRPLQPLDQDQFKVVEALCDSRANARGLNRRRLVEYSGVDNAVQVFHSLQENPEWSRVLIGPGEDARLVPADRANTFRIRWVKMTVIDALFESQSGFSTTGASVLSDLEDDHLVPYCILFWRSSTHFLGGLGIIVLFVVILGQGSAGKALMRTEVPGPTQEGATARMQHTAWVFAAIYSALNVVLAGILVVIGISPFDAICHAFGTMATGGFSTYNSSLGHFAEWDATRGIMIEYVVTIFMILAGTNFMLLYFCLLRKPGKLFSDIEWRTYIGIILVVTSLVVVFGMATADTGFDSVSSSIRYGLFQVVSIVTTTGYGTNDFDQWNNFGRGAILLLMFVGGCAGSTGGGMKVIRHVMFAKILRLEIEHTYHPRVVRVLRIGGQTVDDQPLRRAILVYFGVIFALFILSWLFVIALEPNLTFGAADDNKLIDSASAVASTLNNIGPGLGTVGATENYGHFSGMTKLLFVWLMMLGRLEIFPIIVLFFPSFWRDQ